MAKDNDFKLEDIFKSDNKNETIELLNNAINLLFDMKDSEGNDNLILKTELDKKFVVINSLIEIYEDVFEVGFLRQFSRTYQLGMVSNKRFGRGEITKIINGIRDEAEEEQRNKLSKSLMGDRE